MNQISQSVILRNLCALVLIINTSLAGYTQAATYNSATGELFLPHLINGAKSLSDVVIKLNPDGTYAIQSGIESTLPFICPAGFTATTLDLIKSATGKDAVNSILGCHWHSQQRSIFNDTEGDISVSWLDNSCQTLSIVFDEITGAVTYSSVEENNMGCTLYSAFYPYDISKKLFALQYVRVDNAATASEVYIKFYDGDKYELVSYVITPDSNPPAICNLITEADYLAIRSLKTPGAVSGFLGCKWGTTLISSNDPSTPSYYTWTDHEWNSIHMSIDSFVSITFQQFRIGNTQN